MAKLIKKNYSFFVAGHKGMVGSAIVRRLLESGYCNPSNGGKLYTLERKNLDFLNFDQVSSWFRKYKPNIVILAAAKVGGIASNSKYPFDFLSENLRIQQNVIESAWINDTKRLLFLGSSCIYPKNLAQPIREEELLKNSLEKTNEAYALAKISGIKLCEFLRLQHGFDGISVMPTNLYGPGDNYHSSESHVFASFLRRFINAKRSNESNVTCWGSGNPLREFLHVDDLAKACIFLLENWDPNSPIAPKDIYGNKLTFLNIGTGKDMSIKCLANLIAKYCDYKGNIYWDQSKPDGTFRKRLDTSRIESLGWSPTIKLNEGIKFMINEINDALDKELYDSRILRNFFI